MELRDPPKDFKKLIMLFLDDSKVVVLRIWYVRVEGEGGILSRSLLRVIPPFWKKRIDLGPVWASQYGAAGNEKAAERAFKRLARHGNSK